MERLNVRKNDQVKVIGGSDKGKTGRVLSVNAAKRRVVVEGIRMVKRHVRPNPRLNVKGGIVQKESGIDASNLMVVCPECSRPARMGVRVLADGRRVRYCKKCKGDTQR